MFTPLVPPTGTVTFLFTDIEGSTKLWESSADAMRPALARHDALIRQAIEDHGGYVFKTVGDAFCAAFATAPDALAATLTAQQALASEPWETDTPLRVRMALHTGNAEERNGDYFGQPLNRVARLMSAGYGGQMLLSLATQELTRDQLPPATSLRDLGQRHLKDLGRPEQVFQLLHPSLPADFPPLRSLDNPNLPNNLPQQVTSFIGREKEVAQVKALLTKSRLLTLTGGGGSGKTRLSLQAAADLLDGEGDGVWLVELAPLADPALVPQVVADVLGVKEEGGKPIQRSVVEWLKTKRLLLILDNCEHLVAACASLATDLLRNCPGVHILASSREPLNVSGEQTYRVPSLSLPDLKQPQTMESLTQYEAVRLFIERAQAVRPDFTVTDGNAPAVAQVCWRLDGIPLAIELAAARVRSLSVEEVNARLDNRFRLLTGGLRTALPRQQTLRALIDWSYDLLTEQEKTVLQRLSVFAGGWTLDAAEGVCSGEEAEGRETIEEFEALDLLTSLMDKSLVVYEEGAAGAGRYRLLESIRQYGADRLAEGGGEAGARGRHAAWFLRLAEAAEPQLTGSEGAAWLSRLETEHDNLRAGLSWYEQQSEGAAAGLRLAGALWRFWDVHGHYSEGRHWLERALERTRGQAGAAGGEAAAIRAKALNAAGNLAMDQGDYAVSRVQYEESLTLRRQSGDEGGIAASLSNLGNVARVQGDYAAARPLQEESLAIRRRLGDERGISSSLMNLGNVAYCQGDYMAAQALYEESLIIKRRLGDKLGIADLLHNLGGVAYDQGDYAAARIMFEQNLIVERQAGDERGIAITLHALGDVTSQQGDYAAARTLYVEGLAIRRQLGDQVGLACSLEGLAGVALGQKHSTRTARLLGAADALREALGAPLSFSGREETGKRLVSVREVLGKDAFDGAWETGQAMTLEQAVEYALENAADA